MLEINQLVNIDESELAFTFIRADGPGGQNVNKVSTAVQLRFDVLNSKSLPEEVKQRLAQLAGKFITKEGILVIEAKRYRTQEQNREDALKRLRTLAKKALEKPKVRRKTHPTKASRQARLKGKRIKGEIKRNRQYKLPDDYMD